ncbi:sensor domain-containing diguanylate cyclase [Alcaligenaceae bacterium CGII-47]|nr:sensor domain-containing diguanylate cyclase [Alcaligenaceae bacterium CGII-47]
MVNNILKQWVISILALIIACLTVPAMAQDLIVSRAMLEDASGSLTIADVADSKFAPIGSTLYEGYSDSAYWLRLRVQAPAQGSEVVLRIGPTLLDDVRLYEAGQGDPKEWITRVTGDRHAYQDRDRADIALGFVVNITAPEQTFYLRIQTTSASVLTVEGIEPQHAQRHAAQKSLLHYVFIGLMLWALIWAIDHYIVGRQLAIGLFALYQGVYILYGLSATGNLAPYVPSAIPQLADWLTNVLTCAAPFFFVLFSKELFKRYSPPWMRGFTALLLIFPIQLALMAFDYTRLALNIGAVIYLVAAWYYVALALAATQEHVPSRRVLLTTYIVLALSVTFTSLTDLGWSTLIGTSSKSAWIILTDGIVTSGLLCSMMYRYLRWSRLDAQRVNVRLARSQNALARERAHKELAQTHARTDYLTGLFNRRYFVELVKHEIARALDTQAPLSLLMIDIDYFKQVNDTWGHGAGDVVLQQVSGLIRDALREDDILGRIGGEEFAVALIGTDHEQALEVAQRIRMTVADAVVLLSDGQQVQVTLSLGLTRVQGQDIGFEELLDKADKALYRAKGAGRNIVIAMD